MKKLILIISFLFFGNHLFSQQLMLSSQYMLSQYVINPAAAGQHKESAITLSARQQWAGLEGAPVTQFISFNGKITKRRKMALGTQLFNDVNGAFQTIGWQGSYAYHIQTSLTTRLSIGVSAILSQTTVNSANFIVNDYSDLTLIGGSQKSFNPDISAGIFYFGTNFYLGASGIQLLESKYSFGENLIENKHVNHLYASGGFILRPGPGYKIEPSFLIKAVGTTPIQFDLNTRVFYRESVWVGFSYRNSGATILMLGLKKDPFLIGYAYDFTSSNIKNHSVGSHEIYIQYSFRKKYKGSTKF